MRDKILDFIEAHRKLCIVIIVLVIFFGVCLVIRANNMKNKVPTVDSENTGVIEEQNGENSGLVQDVVDDEPTDNNYLSSIGLGSDKEDDRVVIKDETETETEIETETEPVQTEPTYPVTTNIFGWTTVPKKNMDGSSCDAYLSKVSLSDFGTFWGSKLTEDDFKGANRYLVGVEQNKDDAIVGDLQSVGWLINNLKNLSKNDAIKFTNLHVIGSLSDNHVALLCSYDWYSAFGLKDTLVVFEDISGTLNAKDFKEGDIFSTTVFVHNVKILNSVKGQRVVVVQYDVFK